MTELVRKYRLDFLGRQPGQQRVEKDDAACTTEAGEVGVAVPRPPRAVDDEQAARREIAPGEQLLDPFARGARG